MCAREGNYDQAHECYKQAQELCPENCDAWVASGAAYGTQQEFFKAIQCFDKALGTQPLQLDLWLCYPVLKSGMHH